MTLRCRHRAASNAHGTYSALLRMQVILSGNNCTKEVESDKDGKFEIKDGFNGSYRIPKSYDFESPKDRDNEDDDDDMDDNSSIDNNGDNEDMDDDMMGPNGGMMQGDKKKKDRKQCVDIVTGLPNPLDLEFTWDPATPEVVITPIFLFAQYYSDSRPGQFEDGSMTSVEATYALFGLKGDDNVRLA